MPSDSNVFGLVYHYNNLVRPVPLRGVSVDAHIVDFVVRTAISQHFHNTESFPIEASYVFPIDERAAVCGFEVDIDGVITKGVVQEKHEARATYDQAVARGDGAQLLEQKRTDVFELTVGNLLPGQHATVNIITVADLKIEGDDVRFFLPTFVAPRYHPYTEHDPVPSGTVSRVRDGLQLTINCTMSQAITGIASPSHPVVTAHMPQSKTASVSLAAGTMQLDKDFVLLVRTEQPHEPRVSVEIAEDGSVATMITLAPNIELDDEQCELVFVVDRSGSMSGSKIDQARKAMALFFRSLPSNCFINIVGFGSSFCKLWPTPTKYSDESLRQGSAHIASINADLGGTELLEPLREIFATPLIPGYNRQVFVLTDGEVSNTSAVIDLVRANQGSARVFALGLGEGASHELVEGIARAGRGTAEFVVNDRLEAKVIAQLKTAIQPALNDVTFEWDIPTDATFVPKYPASTVSNTIGSLLNFRKPPPPRRYYTQAPFKVPSILTSTRFLVFCISPPGHRNPTSATVKARTPLGPLAVHVTSRPEDYIRGEVIHKMAARAAIRDLEEGTSYQHSLSGTDRVSEADITREIVRLGVENQLTSKYTSYVAVQPLDSGLKHIPSKYSQTASISPTLPQQDQNITIQAQMQLQQDAQQQAQQRAQQDAQQQQQEAEQQIRQAQRAQQEAQQQKQQAQQEQQDARQQIQQAQQEAQQQIQQAQQEMWHARMRAQQQMEQHEQQIYHQQRHISQLSHQETLYKQRIVDLETENNKFKQDQARDRLNFLITKINNLSGHEVLQFANAYNINLTGADPTKLATANMLFHESFDEFFEELDVDPLLHDPLLRLYSLIKKAQEIGQLPVEHPIAPWIMQQGQPDIAARFAELNYTEDMMVCMDAKLFAHKNGFMPNIIKRLQADFIISQTSVPRLIKHDTSSGGVILVPFNPNSPKPPRVPMMDCAHDDDAEDDAVPVASDMREEKMKNFKPPRATTPSRSPEESQQRLAALQRFDGGFALGNDLAAIVGKSVADLTAASATVFAGNTVPSDIFATALAIWFFENELSDLEDEWQLIVGKARKWLAKANKTSLSVAKLVRLSGSVL